ncbi:MAG: 16S rRNA (cytosine(1402)-N(4))-methyltransferase RsmH [Ruminococcaceae bacterium]|nr:16S rRNA (cytosine(1402)-N(4))-methyltransferase RsmH [Oscillospiraceae bacterium]
MSQATEFHHVPIMLMPCMEALALQPDGIYVDATMGGAGHSSQIVQTLSTGQLIGFDRDPEAIAASRKRLSAYRDKVTFVNCNYADVKAALAELKIEQIHGALMDLGVSSHQLDEAQRGFSYMQDAPLDMRMNQQDSISAAHVVNSYTKDELETILLTYGEERWARRIAEFIVDARATTPIQTTGQLVNIIKKAVPKDARRDGPHPAKRTFQAIRIEVNNELGGLPGAVHDFIDVLAPGGRLAIITFHSLEDRIVKNIFKEREKGCTCPPTYPACICGKKSAGRVITRKPVLPLETEIQENPRARSAKLRVFEKNKLDII